MRGLLLLTVTLGVILIGAQLFGADGDLIVNGKVGIGTTNPTRTLDVGGWTGMPSDVPSIGANISGDLFLGVTGNGVARTRINSSTDTLAMSFNSYWNGSAFRAMDSNKTAWRFTMDGTGDFLEIMRAAATSGNLSYNTLFYIKGDTGRVGIGRTDPAYPLHMASGARVTTGGVWTNASSRDYKKNIEALSTQTALQTVMKLEPVTFVYRSDPDEKHVGFIAEDVPDLVASKDRKGLSSMDIVAVLSKVVQEQQKMIHQLKEDMGELRRDVIHANGPKRE